MVVEVGIEVCGAIRRSARLSGGGAGRESPAPAAHPDPAPRPSKTLVLGGPQKMYTIPGGRSRVGRPSRAPRWGPLPAAGAGLEKTCCAPRAGDPAWGGRGTLPGGGILG